MFFYEIIDEIINFQFHYNYLFMRTKRFFIFLKFDHSTNRNLLKDLQLHFSKTKLFAYFYVIKSHFVRNKYFMKFE